VALVAEHKEAVELAVPPTTLVSALIEKYCAKAGGGLNPKHVSLIFDGDTLARARSLADCDIEDEDQIDVKA
jgi:hypothetical protein